jgi:hypothetical protein
MSMHEWHGGVRHAGGRVAKALGDARAQDVAHSLAGRPPMYAAATAAAGDHALAGLIHGQRG